MVATEQYFPRGGKKPKVGLNDKKKYDFLANSDKIGKKKKYRPKIIRQDVEKDLDYLSDISYEDGDDGSIKALSAEKLSNKTIQEGMVLLGRISSISDTKLTISLPSRLFGFVMASHISVPYTKLLQSYVNDEIESIKSLDELYKVGEYLNVKVLSTTQKDEKTIPALSIMPQDVNIGMTFSSIQDGDIIRGAVESIEDHGYVIDLGLNNCRTFLPMKWAEKNFSIYVGQVIWCVVKKCVKSPSNSIITVTNKLNSLNSSCISGERIRNYSVSDIKPGMAVDFYVSKPLKDGAEGYVLSNNSVGYVHTSQIGKRLLVGKTVKAYLLYVMPLTKLPFFSTRDIFKSILPDMNEEMPHKEGSVIEDAKVSKAFPNIVIFKSNDSVFMMPKRFSQHKEEENLSDIYQRGSEHTIRLMNYCLSDYAYICSDDEKLLKQRHFFYHDFSIGEFVEVVVKTISEKGILVEVESLKGWIPSLHMSDVGLDWSSKSNGKKENIITKKFKIGEKVLTRVLRVDPSKSQLHLTAKPTFLSPEFEVLSSYEDAKVGAQYKGTVETVFKAGILVTFFNGMCAFIHRNELSHENVENIQDIVNIGQIVNCTVISVNLDEKKMVCSLIQSANQSDTENKKKKKKSKQLEDIPNDESVAESSKPKKKNADKKKNVTVDNDASVCELEKNSDSQNMKLNKKKKGEKQNLESDSQSNISLLDKANKKSKKKSKTLSINDSDFTVTENVVNDDHNESNIKSKRKRKIENEEENIISKPKKKNLEKTTISNEDENDEKKLMFETQFSSMANFWNLNASTISNNVNKIASDSSGSESEEEIVEENPKKKKKRLTNAEKVKKAREEEEKLRQIEKDLMEVDSQPKSSDQFDRLLLANPNSSETWIAYMAFHLQATEVDRARAIAKKAINVISFREEHEKMNVWLALLNLENRFGTKESLNSTLKDAVQMNDSFTIHSKMLDMYAETGKVNDLTSLVDLMVAKYKQNPDMYMSAGEACYKLNLVDKARSIMQKAISRLESKQHVLVLTKFAQLENTNGDAERAETLFEQMLGCMPQRVDICGVYVDMLMKSKKVDNARFVLERAVSLKLNARKMKFLFKKWIELEEKFGDPDKIEKVRQMALEYIEKVADRS